MLFHKDVSRSFRRDNRMGQGPANAADKANIASAWTINEILEEIGQNAQVWWLHLRTLADDSCWSSLSPEGKLQRIELRVEYLVFCDLEDKISIGDQPGSGSDVAGFIYRILNANVVKGRMLAEYASTQDVRREEVAVASQNHTHLRLQSCLSLCDR